MSDLWMYRQPMERGLDLEGFDVEAADGKIGTVDEATYEVDSSYIVVDTGPWIFGRKVLLPAGVIDEIDLERRRVLVNRTKEEIRNGPEYDPAVGLDATRRDDYGRYYGRYYEGM
jgi:hypothetical protein